MIGFSWAREDTWAFDSPDYIFFARAFDIVGKQLYLSEWDDTERLLFARGYRASDNTQARFLKTRLEIRARLASGRLVGAVLTRDGSFSEIATGRWSRTESGDWFADCAIPDKVIYDTLWGGGTSFPLFIRRAELDMMIGAVRVGAALEPSAVVSIAVTNVSAKALDDWFLRKVEAAEAGLCARPSKKELYALANTELGGHVTRDRTDALYEGHPGWKRPPGRPRKQRQYNGQK